MNEVSSQEILAYIKENISSIQKEAVLRALKSDDLDEIEAIGFRLSGGESRQGYFRPVGADFQRGLFWLKVKEEVYKYLCTNSSSYAKERRELAGFFGGGVTVISTALASQFAVEAGFAAGVVTVSMISAAKIGKGAWCETVKATLASDNVQPGN